MHFLVFAFDNQWQQMAGRVPQRDDIATMSRARVTSTILKFLSVLTFVCLAAAQGGKPNFIVILTDDQGWDDIGINNPYVKTPNIDRFISRSKLFTNFYTTPQCAQTRAEFLTGRWHPRTGTMGVSGGWDFINRDEATAAHVLAAAGYRTSHFGKWHNYQVLGYQPWHAGFQDGYLEYFTGDVNGQQQAMMVHNGRYYMQPLGQQGSSANTMSSLSHDSLLTNKVLEYLKLQANSSQPLFIYFAARSIHVNSIVVDSQGRHTQRRVVPAAYKDKWYNNPAYKAVPNATLDAWAFLEYLDDNVGQIFDYLQTSGLDNSTYVFMMGDNGSALLAGENSPTTRKYRMPSKMRGDKSSIYEGGIRNWLAVSGPGVQPGTTDSSLRDITDLLPTMTDLAGVDPANSTHRPWDGISFQYRLLTKNETMTRRRVNRRQQHMDDDRVLVTVSPGCWSPNAVPDLDGNRNMIYNQTLLSWKAGGMLWGAKQLGFSGGIKQCTAVRWKSYKYIGTDDTVYNWTSPLCAQQRSEWGRCAVKGPELASLKSKMLSAAQSWWESLLNEPHAFKKPTFYFGLGDFNVTNMLAAGAHERTPGAITLFTSGAAGFRHPADRMCFKTEVLKAGLYEVVPMYTSNVQAMFKLSFGTFSAITSGTAPSITAELPALANMKGMIMGQIFLPKSGTKNTEACLEMLNSTAPGMPVFKNLGNIRITWISNKKKGINQSQGQVGSRDSGSSKRRTVPVAQSAPGLDQAVGQEWLLSSSEVPSNARQGMLSTMEHAWKRFRYEHSLPDGQTKLESLYSPYNSEGIEGCSEGLQCTPDI